MWTAAILAGGRGRRLGGIDKSALQVGGRSILDRQLALVRQITPHILIVGSHGGAPAAAGIRTVPDRVAGAGALGGLYTALMEATTDQVLVMACDMPFVTIPLLAELAARGAHADAVMPRDDRGPHPLCASYLRRIAPHLRACIDAGALGVQDALRALDVQDLDGEALARLDDSGVLLLNVNSPDDYARAVAVAGAIDQSPEKGT
jgi:molybdenum cofactor guanylyltransferase